jgi:O-antigen/teichoic acid export membrane protein
MNYASLGKNAILYSIGTMAIRTASFLLIPIYTYSLTVADYGLLSVLLQTAQIMVIVIGIGSRTALVRFASEYENRGEIGTLLGTSIFINLIGAAAVTGVSVFFLLPFFKGLLHTESVLRYVLLTCAAGIFNCLAFHLMTYYRAGHKGLQVTLASVGGAVALIAVTAVLVRYMRWGIQGALLAQALIYGLLAGSFLLIICRRIRLSVSLTLTWSLVRFGLPLILVMSGGLLTQTSALYFLSYVKGLEAAGIYSLGFKMAAIAEMVLILPFEMAYEPFVYGHIGHPALWKTISSLLTYLMTAFAFIACAIVFAARDTLPLIAPAAFGPAYLIIFLILPALAFRGVYYIGESLLFVEKRTDIACTVVMICALLSVLLNYLFIWRWGMYGAAAVYVISTVCTGAFVLKLGLRRAPVPLEHNRLWAAAMLGAGFLLTVYSLRTTSNAMYYSIVPLVVFAATLGLYASRFIHQNERHMIRQFLRRAQRSAEVERA